MSAAAPERFDLILDNVTVVTPGQPVARDMAVAVRDGAIMRVAPRHHLGESPTDRRIDGRGGLLMPGLVNTHNHSPLMIVRGMVEDIGFAPAYTKGVPQGHWLSDEETLALSRLGLLEMIRFGCTSIVDYYRKPLALAKAAQEAGIRAFIGGRVMDVDTAALAEGRFQHDPALGEETLADNLTLISDWDGANNGLIRCFYGPHAPDTVSRALFRQISDMSAKDGRQVHTHLAQSRMEIAHMQDREGMRSSDFLEDVGVLNERLVAAHCIFLEEDEIRKLGKAGIQVAHAPIGNASFGAAAPIADLREAGAHITLCTDTKSGDMFEAMRMALASARLRAKETFVFDAATAFDWATTGGAQALGLGQAVGRIEPGFRADLTLLDSRAPNLYPVVDGFGVIAHLGSGANVRTVICDGQVLIDDGRATWADEDEIIATAQSVADRIWQRARAA
ncbi:amidohydrolase family protein [Affinirhizobium pseudoryzae]|uniref:amidohydrolase family protein n=1 Tax=Allorhizobium pseudoryzae TaxID=379684 RepID=UPI001F20589F|nr:amidohydrolase family protein [Allorhizobium pseudoryzae]